MNKKEILDILDNAKDERGAVPMRLVRQAFNKLPSVQPEQPTEVQDILQYLDEYLHPIVSPEHWSVYSELYDMVSMLQSSQPEQRWIPCSEKLPEDGTEVFVYLYHNPKSPYIAWIEDSRWYTEEFEVDREYEPLAWMPLPEPYAEGREERI